MNTFAEQVGQRIRTARERKGWSQTRLAVEVGGGRTQAAISYWEAGLREPGLHDIVRLSQLLGVPVGQLLGGEHEPVGLRDRAAADSLHHRALSERAWACHDYHAAIYQRGVADGLDRVSMYAMPGDGPDTTGSATGAPAPASHPDARTGSNCPEPVATTGPMPLPARTAYAARDSNPEPAG